MEVQYQETPPFKTDLHTTSRFKTKTLRIALHSPFYSSKSEVSKHTPPQAQRSGRRPKRLTRPRGARTAGTEGQRDDLSEMPPSPREAREAPGRPAEQQGLPGPRGVRGTAGRARSCPPPKLSDAAAEADLPFPPGPPTGSLGPRPQAWVGEEMRRRLPEETRCPQRRLSGPQAETSPAAASHPPPSLCIRTALYGSVTPSCRRHARQVRRTPASALPPALHFPEDDPS